MCDKTVLCPFTLEVAIFPTYQKKIRVPAKTGEIKSISYNLEPLVHYILNTPNPKCPLTRDRFSEEEMEEIVLAAKENGIETTRRNSVGETEEEVEKRERMMSSISYLEHYVWEIIKVITKYDDLEPLVAGIFRQIIRRAENRIFPEIIVHYKIVYQTSNLEAEEFIKTTLNSIKQEKPSVIKEYFEHFFYTLQTMISHNHLKNTPATPP